MKALTAILLALSTASTAADVTFGNYRVKCENPAEPFLFSVLSKYRDNVYSGTIEYEQEVSEYQFIKVGTMLCSAITDPYQEYQLSNTSKVTIPMAKTCFPIKPSRKKNLWQGARFLKEVRIQAKSTSWGSLYLQGGSQETTYGCTVAKYPLDASQK